MKDETMHTHEELSITYFTQKYQIRMKDETMHALSTVRLLLTTTK